MSGFNLYALLGAPVHHSLSPALHNAAFQALQIDGLYVALRTWDELVGPLMRSLAGSGGGGNVTLPHKRAAADSLDRASEDVRATGACNVFWWEEGVGLCGDNTDVEAFCRAAEAVLGSSLKDRRILVLGAGGAARAVVHGCVREGASGVDIVNRTRARAEGLARDLGSPANVSVLDEVDARSPRTYDLVVNATSLGLAPSDPLPLDPGAVKCEGILDLVYGREGTRLVNAARDAAKRAEDGRRMLVEQATASFARWFDREPPREVMYEVVRLSD